MNVAKWLLWAVLALPAVELAVFVAVAVTIGFLPALALLVAVSVTGALILRHAGGNHISRMRAALGQTSFTALRADELGSLTLLGAILLLIPGFITGVLGLLLLVVSLGRAIAARLGYKTARAPEDGIVDLPPEQWHRVPDPELPDRREQRPP